MARRHVSAGVVGRYAKAIGSAAAAFIGSLVTALIVKEGDPSWGDLALADWLTAVSFALGALGLTAVIPKGDELARLDVNGVVRAGPAAVLNTGQAVGAGVPVADLVPADPSADPG